MHLPAVLAWLSRCPQEPWQVSPPALTAPSANPPLPPEAWPDEKPVSLFARIFPPGRLGPSPVLPCIPEFIDWAHPCGTHRARFPNNPTFSH